MMTTTSRVRLRGSVAAAVLLGVVGCSDGTADGAGGADGPTPAAVTSERPASGAPSPRTTSSSASSTPVPTDLPQDVLLPASALQPSDGPRTVTSGVEPWVLSTGCDLGRPSGAVQVLSLRQGDGQFEVPVGVQQVAVYADADAAQAEAARVAGAASACAAAAPGSDGGGTRYRVTPLDVGAQGTSIVTDYYGVTADDPAADGIGDAVAVLRRGTAVVLVGAAGGEDSMSGAQARVAGYAQQAWERLCRYQVEGCA
ncbi:hypothetical protein FHN55_14775 [Streptomyces sp. NP160]|uniref:hypothetical protein n=1 Tax=Streptomyces sp. NP160 TaxID=2586637 RepID=UPI001118068E|nr:hypothetical protein [Streptomyces sp. NP160]TNM64093.1 hypothetical protein FHN55_14775 [Streptomyces sp. NP160]